MSITVEKLVDVQVWWGGYSATLMRTFCTKRHEQVAGYGWLAVRGMFRLAVMLNRPSGEQEEKT